MAKNNKKISGEEIEYDLSFSPEDNKEKKAKKEGKTPIALKITALCLCAVTLVMAIIGLVLAFNGGNKKLDYVNDNLGAYVSIHENDYKKYFNVTVDIPEPGEQKVKDKIIALLYKHRTAQDGDPVYTKNADISAGDVANIYYRGYTLNADGTKNYFDGGCNFNSSTFTSLEIGSGSFISGFEYNLIGENQKDHATLNKIDAGVVKVVNADDYAQGKIADLVLITYSATYADGSSAKSQTAIIDPSDPNLNAKWGKGFYEFWQETPVEINKSFTLEVDTVKTGTSVKKDYYTDITATEIYRIDTSKGDILKVEAYFPHDYQETTLQGKTAWFETFIVSTRDYEVPEYNDAFITDNLKLTADDLAEFDGATLAEKYTNKIKAELAEEHQDSINAAVESEFWTYIVKVAKFKKLPKGDVKDYYNNMYAEIASAYTQYQDYYASIDTFALAYMGLSTGDDWKEILYQDAEEVIKQKLAFYYIINKEGYLPSEAEKTEIYNRLINEQVVSYLASMQIDENNSEYATKYDEAKQQIIEYYDESYWDSQIVYEYGMKKICALANVTNKALEETTNK